MNILVGEKLGAKFPEKITLSASVDGKDFEPMHGRGITFFHKGATRAEWTREIGSRPLLVLLEPNGATGRYIKAEITTGGS